MKASKYVFREGDAVGRLTVISSIPELSYGRGHYRCKCQCGTEKLIATRHLGARRVLSCGCLHRDVTKAARHQVTHGMTKTPTYKTWIAMRRRCEYPDDCHYPSYGGRGISVCDRWSSFENFLNDMGARPDGMTIDRINNDGNYEPSNCRWATASEQQRNTRRSTPITWRGETKILIEWAETFKVRSYKSFASRVKALGPEIIFEWAAAGKYARREGIQ